MSVSWMRRAWVWLFFRRGRGRPLSVWVQLRVSACLAGGSPMDCKGANRSALTAALIFYPIDPLQIKLEYRHDRASLPVFAKADGSMTRYNNVFSAQAVYHF